MFSNIMSTITSKLTLILFVVLLVSGTLNYALYNKVESTKLLVAQKEILIREQEQSIKDLNKSINLNQTIRDIGDAIVKDTFQAIELNNNSFDSLLFSLPKIPTDCKPILDVHKPISGIDNEKAIDPDVNAYYDKLHSAYNLQNKH